MHNAIPTVAGIPIEFVLFAAVLACVALLHHHSLRVALIGLATITLYKIAFSSFHGVTGVGGLAEATHSRLQRRLHGLVALVRSLVLSVALDLGLDVRHGAGLDRCTCRSGLVVPHGRRGDRTRDDRRYQRAR